MAALPRPGDLPSGGEIVIRPITDKENANLCRQIVTGLECKIDSLNAERPVWYDAIATPPPIATPVLVWGRPERGDESEVGLEQIHDDGLWYGWYEITHWRALPEGPEGK